MEAKLIARYLGAMSIEERVQIIKCLLEAGPDGREMLDIAARIELGAAAVSKQLESLMGLELVPGALALLASALFAPQLADRLAEAGFVQVERTLLSTGISQLITATRRKPGW